MSIKITVLGSGPSEVIPRKNCQCPACLDAKKPKSKSRRTRSSLFLAWHGKNILFDCGPDFFEQIAREKIKKIDAVFLTHAHFDAAENIKNAPAPVFAEKQTLKYLGRLHGKLPPHNFIKPNHPVKIGPLSVIPFRVHHAVNEKTFPTLGFKIGPVVFASDVISVPKSSEKYFQNAQILFLDSAMWFGKKIPWHLSTDQAISLAKKFKVKKLYLTHLGHSWPPHRAAEKEIRKYCFENNIKFPVMPSFDGLKTAV
jgi:phosphoribosyl 1,2-cyclic phosphate phosphodiesterase